MPLRILALLIAIATVGAGALTQGEPAVAAGGSAAGSISRETAIEQLRTTRSSIDRSLAQMKAGQREQAFATRSPDTSSTSSSSRSRCARRTRP